MKENKNFQIIMKLFFIILLLLLNCQSDSIKTKKLEKIQNNKFNNSVQKLIININFEQLNQKKQIRYLDETRPILDELIKEKIVEIIKKTNNPKIEKLDLKIDYSYFNIHSFKYSYILKINDEIQIQNFNKITLNFFEFNKEYEKKSKIRIAYFSLVGYLISNLFSPTLEINTTTIKIGLALTTLVSIPFFWSLSNTEEETLPKNKDYTLKNLQPMFYEIEKNLRDYYLK